MARYILRLNHEEEGTNAVYEANALQWRTTVQPHS